MRSADDVVALFQDRKRARGPLIGRMRELRDAVNGEMVIPLPEVDRSERPAVANLIDQGLSQSAQRVASTLPDLIFPAVVPGQELSEKRAGERQRAVLSWWSMNRLGLMQRKRARFLLGYGMAPCVIRPDPKRKIPVWQLRDPLQTFPPPGDDLEPDDCIFTFQRSLGWLRNMYPGRLGGLRVPRDAKPDLMLDVVEFVDGVEHQLIVMGSSATEQPTWDGAAGVGAGVPYIQLEQFENLAGRCTAVVPGRITLDRQHGQFDSLVGLYWTQAKLMALETIAVERAIFPDEWLVSRPNEVAQIVSMADGLAGEIGRVQGGQIVQNNISPGVQTYPTLDRIERAMRLNGGVPAEMGGESGQNIRTARRGAQVLSSAVDFPIQEAQEILAAALQAEDQRAIAIDKAFFSKGGKRAFYFSWNGKRGRVEYDPEKVWETDEHVVAYPYPGYDANQVTIGTGQRIGMGTMSKLTGMRIDPAIDDPDAEHDQIIAESLELAFLSSIQTQASQGGIGPADLAVITRLVLAEQRPLYEAVEEAQRLAQERQSPAPEAGGPADPMAPEAQPGLSPPGAGAEAGVAVPEQPSSMGNLSQLLRSLGTVSRSGV